MPRSRPIEAEKSSRAIKKKKPSESNKKRQTKKSIYFESYRPTGTYQDGSSLIPAPTGMKRLARGKSSGGRSASTSSSKIILPQRPDDRPHTLEWCSRCGGGEIPNCPQCDGVGYFKRYETDSPSNVVLGRSSPISGQMSTPLPLGNPSSVADHEAVGRSDPLDANRGTSSIRDRGQFGSMPLHDNYDE